MSTTAVVPVSQIESLPAEVREQALTAYLANARDALAHAVEASGPASVAQIKAEVATVAEMTKQLGLSRECRDDATEMVRRAEYALGKAIRKGQEEGTIHTREGGGQRWSAGAADQKESVYDFAKHSDLYGDGRAGGNGIYAMADNAPTEQDFEDALTEAREEGNLSRANVVRKIKGEDSGTTRDQRAEQIARLAREGYTSKQIAPKVGYSRDDLVRQVARDYGIDIPADRVTSRRRRLDADRILSGAAESVSAAAYSLQQIDPLDLDQEAAQEWVDSLTESLTALRKALNPIKESLRG